MRTYIYLTPRTERCPEPGISRLDRIEPTEPHRSNHPVLLSPFIGSSFETSDPWYRGKELQDLVQLGREENLTLVLDEVRPPAPHQCSGSEWLTASSFIRGISTTSRKRIWGNPSRPLLMWKTLTPYDFNIGVGAPQYLIRHSLGLGCHHRRFDQGRATVGPPKSRYIEILRSRTTGYLDGACAGLSGPRI